MVARKKAAPEERSFLLENNAPAERLAAQLDAIIERLPSLRSQGVTRIQVGDVDLQIEPPAPEAQPRHPAAPPDDFLDPSKFRRNRNESADLDDE